ncbi:MAG: DUF4390 domain-containing protein [Nitrospirota bacterium]
MKKAVVLFIFLAIFTGYNTWANASSISNVTVTTNTNNMIVSASLSGFSKEFIDAIHNGIEKEITFHIDVFRVWRYWPDEFIASKTIQRTIKYDMIKKDYRITSYDGLYLSERMFSSFDDMKKWVTVVDRIKVLDTSVLQPDSLYFVRVMAESKFRKLHPLLEYVLFFVPTSDFKTEWKKSQFFTIKRSK